MVELMGRSLCYAYGDAPALLDVSVSLRSGSVQALVGPSGSGKSTLLRVLGGLIRPQSGSVVLRENGRDTPVHRPPAAERPCPHPPALWGHLTVEQHLRLVAGRHRRQVVRVLEQLSLGGLRRRRPAELSSGQRQRLSLARALVHRPRWLLLDEPLAHLEGGARVDLMCALRAAIEESGAAALVATHQPDEAMALAECVTVLLGGRVVQCGTVREIYETPTSVAVALTLGPASQISGVKGAGNRSIFRPHHLRFAASPTGAATVLRCDFASGRFHLTVSLAGRRCVVEHEEPVPVRTTGDLRCRQGDFGLYQRADHCELQGRR